MLSESNPPRRRPFHRILFDRLQGPGGYYNMGNAVSLIVGIGLQVTLTGNAATIGTYLAGSASAVALTLATILFFYSGEIYHRAWEHGAPPDAHLNRHGDLLSGIGAIILGIALFIMAQPILAAFSGLLHACGKFGSAWHGPRPLAPRWPDPFRTAVLISRIPAIIATLVALLQPQITGTQTAATLAVLTSYLLWTRADLMLFRS